MAQSRLRLALLASAIGTALLLALPGFSLAHEAVTIDEEDTLTITGDFFKPNDLITVDYDSIKDEYVIGHDIVDPIPSGCYRDAIEPFHKLHCPRSRVRNIKIYALSGTDSVKVGFDTTGFPGDFSIDALFPDGIEAFLGEGDDEFDGGTEADIVDLGEGNNKANTGGGNDKVASGGGEDNIDTGAGADEASVGGGNDKVSTGDGDDKAVGGDGNDKLDTGAGNDSAAGGKGNDAVSTGDGDDMAGLGVGKDTGRGGNGNDKLVGGKGLDHLFGEGGADWLLGGPGPDYLIGGPDSPDHCAGGPGTERAVIGCEVGYRY